MPEFCDLLISGRWLLPIAPENRVIEHGAVAVLNGRIAAVGPHTDLTSAWQPDERIDLGEHLLMPGLVNTHGHAAMTLLRGSAEDLPLQGWLADHIWPMEARFMNSDFVADGTRLAIAEMIRSGTTCFADMYFYPETAAQVAAEAGVRAQLAFPIVRFENAWSSSAEDALHKGLALHDDWRASEFVHIAFGPHSAYTAAREDLEKTLMYAEELQAQIQIHLHENRTEVEDAEVRIGHSWVEELADIGMLCPSLQAVHMTTLSESEIALIAERGVHVVHCPHSNFKLASGLCPTHKLRQHGVELSLGTDGAASNNGLDLFAEARLAALLLKYQARDAANGDAASMLHMLTLGGAKTLGLEADIGSIEPGKAADLIAIDMAKPGLAPVYDPMGALVHGAPGHAVTDVWVAGRRLLTGAEHTSIDLRDTLQRANHWREKMS
ncbi:MAG: TRZ/ATZ family hydrolase [Pseudomonadales bacterium]|jgi:5-methylthioadenosine/S-adenosylhomocysteine deaminase|nr:TRZ/ATZ family hydrolase [Pseudomonadales bacterium]MDP6472052.1 TRZ/ATZ family hydrolase [Pseudomonadales bacterium]MDP6826675.1 TRZ/ATZ family hydrolase [Pseudomonadales bacterium]MDP6969964.1 TRZ/ATZ family hydrolase [Pseudomonadales bacterium]